jgi:hypothetical protein
MIISLVIGTKDFGLFTQNVTKSMTIVDGHSQDVSSTNNSHVIDVLIGYFSLYYHDSDFGS